MLRRQGNLTKSKRLVEIAVQCRPSNLSARLTLVLVNSNLRAAKLAELRLKGILEKDPACSEAFSLLLTALRRQARCFEAAELGVQSAYLLQRDERASNLGRWHLELARFEIAEAHYEKALAENPGDIECFLGLVSAIQGQGNHRKALQKLREAVDEAPDSAALLERLTSALLENGDEDLGAHYAGILISLDSQAIAGHCLMAQARMAENQPKEAEEFARTACAIAPWNARARSQLGAVLQAKGMLSDAAAEHRRAIAIEPSGAAAYFHLIVGRKVTNDDALLIETMLELSRNEPSIVGEPELLHYALGKAHEDLERYGEAMSSYDRANRLAYKRKFGCGRFDREAHVSLFEAIKGTFTSEVFEDPPVEGSESTTPVIVVGMLRSGTTLMEQIISCHHRASGVGESRFWPRNRERAFETATRLIHWGQLQELAQGYLDSLQKGAPGAERIVDKMPTNYLNLGLIHLAFPRAKIIHMRRHPIDTCLSVYATQNNVRIPWANDKANIAFNYSLYDNLMRHWRSHLPPDSFLEINYETLVSEQEQITGKVLDFLDLEWDPACLRPEQNANVIRTPSVWQARQPVYGSSMGRWTKFEPWLGEIVPKGVECAR